MPEPRVYAPADRPEVEVLVDGEWMPGELRAWSQREGTWWGNAQWSAGPAQNHLDTFPEDRIRPAGSEAPTLRSTDEQDGARDQ